MKHKGEGEEDTVFNTRTKERTERRMTEKTQGVEGQKCQATVSPKTPE